MAHVFVESLLSLVLILHPDAESLYRWDVIHSDPRFFLVLAGEEDLAVMKRNGVKYQNLGLWKDLYPSALASPEEAAPLPGTYYARRGDTFLISWESPEPAKWKNIVVLPEHARKIRRREEDVFSPRSVRSVSLHGFFSYDSFLRYLDEITGTVPFEYQGESYTIATRSYFAMTLPEHPDAMAVEYLVQTLTDLGLEPEVLPFAVSTCGAHRNVAVTFPGYLYPEQYVYVTAHFDDRPYWGSAPGADDNGSGVVTLLTIAEAFRCFPLQRSVRLVWFSAEEIGLCGSRGLLDDLTEEERSRVVADINGDMFGYDGNGDGLFGIHAGLMVESQELGYLMADAVIEQELPVFPIVYTDDAVSASDHGSFWDYGIPAIEVAEDFYFDFNPDYHSSEDKIENMDLEYTYNIGKAMAWLALALANPDEDADPQFLRCPKPPYSSVVYSSSDSGR